MSAFDPGTVEYGAVALLGEYLTLQDPAVFEREMKDVASRRVGHGVESHDGCGWTDFLEGVPHTTQIALTKMQAPNTAECLSVGHLRHFQHLAMQTVLLAILAALLATVNSGAQPRTDSVIDEVRRALQADDRERVASMMHYPLPVTFGSVRVPFAGPPALLERFDDVFTPHVRNALITSLTIEVIDGRPRVTAITVPPAGTSASGAATADQRIARRIAVRGGPRPTRMAGSLSSGGVDTYLVFVQKGQLLQVRLDRGRTEAVVEVVNADSGRRIGPEAGKGVVVSDRVPESADYRISVRYTGPADAPPLPYVVSVSIR